MTTLTPEQKARLQHATLRAIEWSFCVLLALLIIAVLAQMNVWQVCVVLVAYLAGVGCSFVVTGLAAIDLEDDERKGLDHD